MRRNLSGLVKSILDGTFETMAVEQGDRERFGLFGSCGRVD